MIPVGVFATVCVGCEKIYLFSVPQHHGFTLRIKLLIAQSGFGYIAYTERLMVIRFVVETYFAIEVCIMCTIDVVRDTFPFGGSVQLQLGMTGGVCVRLIEVPFDKDVQSAGTII